MKSWSFRIYHKVVVVGRRNIIKIEQCFLLSWGPPQRRLALTLFMYSIVLVYRYLLSQTWWECIAWLVMPLQHTHWTSMQQKSEPMHCSPLVSAKAIWWGHRGFSQISKQASFLQVMEQHWLINEIEELLQDRKHWDLMVVDRLLVSGALDATVSLFELETLTCLCTFSKFDHPARGVSFSADSNYIAYFSEGTPGVNIEKIFHGRDLSHQYSIYQVSDDWMRKSHTSKEYQPHIIKVLNGPSLDAYGKCLWRIIILKHPFNYSSWLFWGLWFFT